MLDYCRQHALTFIAHGPLGGLKAKRGDRALDAHAALADAARQAGVSNHALALALMIDVS